MFWILRFIGCAENPMWKCPSAHLNVNTECFWVWIMHFYFILSILHVPYIRTGYTSTVMMYFLVWLWIYRTSLQRRVYERLRLSYFHMDFLLNIPESVPISPVKLDSTSLYRILPSKCLLKKLYSGDASFYRGRLPGRIRYVLHTVFLCVFQAHIRSAPFKSGGPDKQVSAWHVAISHLPWSHCLIKSSLSKLSSTHYRNRSRKISTDFSARISVICFPQSNFMMGWRERAVNQMSTYRLFNTVSALAMTRSCCIYCTVRELITVISIV